MLAVYLLTAFALGGVAVGVYLIGLETGSGDLSPRLTAMGSGLLVGLALFWVLPEIAGIAGWAISAGLALVGLLTLALLEALIHRFGERSLSSIATALLGAAAVHSFLDGWSTRLLSTNPVSSVAVPLGLGLHKFPEGLAMGFVSRKAFRSRTTALVVSGGIECFTIVGALVEPEAERLGLAKFGFWWETLVLCVVAGSFLFLGLHGMTAHRRKPDALGLFAASIAVVGLLAATNSRIR